MTITKTSFKNKSIATLLTLAYLIVVLYNIITERKDISCTKFSEDCNHLKYEWSPMKMVNGPSLMYLIYIPLFPISWATFAAVFTYLFHKYS